MAEQFLSPQALAVELDLHVNTLVRWRASRVGPPWIRVGGRVRYRPADIAAWLTKRTVDAGGAA